MVSSFAKGGSVIDFAFVSVFHGFHEDGTISCPMICVPFVVHAV
jgi:hypothetical protein